MVRVKQTARKTTAVRPRSVQVQAVSLDDFYFFKMKEGQTVYGFLQKFMQRWASVHQHHYITELDGVIQLALALPPRWQPWAFEMALNFVSPDMECRVTGNLKAFVKVILDTYRFGYPPPSHMGDPLDPHNFILAVHKILDDIIHPTRKPVELEAKEASSEETEPMECVIDNPIENPSEVVGKGKVKEEEENTPIDLDLYEQLFASNSPSPVIFPLTPLLEDLPESFLSAFLQPLPFDNISVGTSTFEVGGPSGTSVVNAPSTTEYQVEVMEDGNEVLVINDDEASD